MIHIVLPDVSAEIIVSVCFHEVLEHSAKVKFERELSERSKSIICPVFSGALIILNVTQ